MRISDRYILFWGGKLSKFSNFCPCEIHYEGNIFHSLEQLYMYFKAMTFGDLESVRAICEEQSPTKAKALGQQVKNYDEANWLGQNLLGKCLNRVREKLKNKLL